MLLVLAMALSLVACGGGNDAPAEEEKAPAVEESQPAEESKPVEEAKPALDYPKKTVEFIIPYAAGGGADVMLRALLAELPYTTMVTNIAGASSSIGTMEALHRDGDGYTVLCHLPESMTAYSMNGTFAEPADELMEPICAPVIDPMCAVIASNNGKFSNLEELIAYGKANPGEIKWCATGTKSQNHMISAMHWTAMDLDVTYLPFDSGAKSRTALLGGNADVFVTQISEVATYVASGDMIPLCVYDYNRSSILPDCPTAEEVGYEGLISVSHRGLVAVPGTPKEVMEFWSNEFKALCENEEVCQKLRDLGYDPVFSTGEEIRGYQENIKVLFADATKLVE
jgi:tripartite-type tricarboxylate transporter receptor subunit TctC